MKRRHKFYLKINLMSVVFIIVSFMSVTLAWFAYSGLADVSTEVNVKAWYVELEQDGETVSNDVTISLTDIYPGMNIVSEVITIKNLGDSNASLGYEITAARLLDDPSDDYFVDGETVTSEEVEDIISHDYPFNINITLDKYYAVAETGEATFTVSVSWPLDSGDDAADSEWGTNAYLFQQAEQAFFDADPEYEMRPSIKVEMKITAEQYLDLSTSSDIDYNLGDTILFDVVNNTTCSTISSTCLETFVIDKNNTLGDNIVTLLPNPDTSYASTTYNNYATDLTTLTSTWTVSNRALTIEDILDAYLISSAYSPIIIGNLNYTGRMATELAKLISYSGYYRITNTAFPYFAADACYWINSEYDTSNAFAAIKMDATYSKIYPETKTTSCNLVPVLEVNKTDL